MEISVPTALIIVSLIFVLIGCVLRYYSIKNKPFKLIDFTPTASAKLNKEDLLYFKEKWERTQQIEATTFILKVLFTINVLLFSLQFNNIVRLLNHLLIQTLKDQS